MTVSPPHSTASNAGQVPLARLLAYLQDSGWTLVDDDGRSSMWRPPPGRGDSVRVVLPATEHVTDYADRVWAALRAVAFAERRAPEDVLGDVEYGGADTFAIRLAPADTPPGQASLAVAHTAITALRNLVVGSAAALDVEKLVLPARRPLRAEAYAAQTRLSTGSGSFVINLSLPLSDHGNAPEAEAELEQVPLLDVQSQPYGRRVGLRMVAAAERGAALARQVGAGDLPIRSFGVEPHAPNATELAALAMLGGPEQVRYRLRFTPSPLVPGAMRTVLAITPAEQRILGEVADYLRTRQPRSDVTVVGEDQYNEAVRAHRDGLRVLCDSAGTRRRLS